jgi:hypothetical protein
MPANLSAGTRTEVAQPAVSDDENAHRAGRGVEHLQRLG